MRNFSLFLLLTACSAKTVGACAKTTDCASGQFCSSGKCSAAQCTTNTDCGSGKICSSTLQCVAQSSTGSTLTITDVHGDTSNPTDAGSHEGYVVTSGFVVAGTGFDSTLKAQLVDAAQKAYPLLIANPDATSFSAALPTEVVALIASGKTAFS